MKNPDSENTTRGEVFKYEYFLAIKNFYNEMAADRIANAIYEEAVIKRKGSLNEKEFKKIAESIVPESKIKEKVVRELIEQFEICNGGPCINQCHLKPEEPGNGLIPCSDDGLDEDEDDEDDDFEEDAGGGYEEMELKSEGECSCCKKIFSKSEILRHLESCEKRAEKNSKDKSDGRVFLLKAESSPFWVYFEANASEKLEEIDSFLRGLWLECCGHLSAFTISKVHYNSDGPGEAGGKGMSPSLDKAAPPGTSFTHEYDFGTTTSLEMKCISERKGKVKGINIIARNNLPDFKCKCGKPAKEVCSECIWEGKGFLCQSCAKKHRCGEDMLLPVVNSPRMGMCGYTGD